MTAASDQIRPPQPVGRGTGEPNPAANSSVGTPRETARSGRATETVEVAEGSVHKALSVHPIRYATFAKLNLRFDHRYDRSIQLNADQLAEHIWQCAAVLAVMRRGS